MQGASSKVSAAFSLYGLELSTEKSSLSIPTLLRQQDRNNSDKIWLRATKLSDLFYNCANMPVSTTSNYRVRSIGRTMRLSRASDVSSAVPCSSAMDPSLGPPGWWKGECCMQHAVLPLLTG